MNFKVTAEDGAKGNKMEVFDLLADKVRSQVKLTKKGTGKTIDSAEMYEVLRREYKAKEL